MTEIIGAIVGGLFTLLGIWLAYYLHHRKPEHFNLSDTLMDKNGNKGEQANFGVTVSTHPKRRWLLSILVFFIVLFVVDVLFVVGILDDTLRLHDFTPYFLILGLIVTTYVTVLVWRGR